MSFDGNLLRKLTTELQTQLTSGRVNKIYQLSAHDLLFNIKTKEGKKQLIVSASPNYARIHLTEMNHERPERPPTFCMFLRKHIESGVIKSIKQIENDRVIVFEFDTRNELGDRLVKKLVIEVTGRHANIIITDEHYKILEAIKHIMPFDGSERTIFPGAIYRPPTTDKLDPFNEIARNEFLDNPENWNEKALLNNFTGFSPLVTKEIMYRYEQGLKMKDIFDTILSDVSPCIVSGKKDYFYYTNITHIEGPIKSFETVNQLLDRYYFERDSIDVIRQRSKDIIKFIRNYIQKDKHKIEKLAKELKNTDKRDKFKIKGELIQANMYNITKGDSKLVCINYYTNEEETIELDPKKNALENMEKFYKKYKKLRVSIPYIQSQTRDAKLELRYFERLLDQVESASLKDIEEIKYELEQNGYLKQKQQLKNKKSKKKSKKPNYDTFFDSEGIEILVGKNNIQNEFITHKLAKHNEVWFHVKDAGGSHVVVRKQFPLSETTIRTASQLASYFSKLRKSGTVPVDYVEVRYIKKVPGRINSFVTYKNNKTIYIDPDEDFIINLRKK